MQIGRVLPRGAGRLMRWGRSLLSFIQRTRLRKRARRIEWTHCRVDLEVCQLGNVWMRGRRFAPNASIQFVEGHGRRVLKFVAE